MVPIPGASFTISHSSPLLPVPELPDVTVYVEALRRCIVGQVIRRLEFVGPFVLRTVTPPAAEFEGHMVQSIERLGKRIVVGVEGDRYLVVHLMIAGRFRWLAIGKKPPGKLGLANSKSPRRLGALLRYPPFTTSGPLGIFNSQAARWNTVERRR